MFEARKEVAAGNFHTLTTRGLAAAAGVSQPTLYNLIGTKEDIMKALVKESFDRIFERIKSISTDSALEAIEAVVLGSVALYAEDETYYRAGGIASDQLLGPIAANAEDKDVNKNNLAAQAVGMAKAAVENAIKKGLLLGRLTSAELAEQMYIAYRGIHRDWAYGLISIDTFRLRAMRSFYVTLAVDATPDFRNQIEQKLFALVPENLGKSFQKEQL